MEQLTFSSSCSCGTSSFSSGRQSKRQMFTAQCWQLVVYSSQVIHSANVSWSVIIS